MPRDVNGVYEAHEEEKLESDDRRLSFHNTTELQFGRMSGYMRDCATKIEGANRLLRFAEKNGTEDKIDTRKHNLNIEIQRLVNHVLEQANWEKEQIKRCLDEEAPGYGKALEKIEQKHKVKRIELEYNYRQRAEERHLPEAQQVFLSGESEDEDKSESED